MAGRIPMMDRIRSSLSQAPPWVSYGLAAMLVAIPVGIIAWEVMPERPDLGGDKHYYCPECDDGFTVSAEEARTLMRAAAQANPGGQALVKCPKCGKYTCAIGYKCGKCGSYFPAPEGTGTGLVMRWRDECPKCGFSSQRDDAVRAALKMKKEGTYDPDKLPDFIVEAVEDAEESGQYDE
jgi:hypothetical protein